MINWLIILAIVASIALGYKTKFNTGLFGMVFAYLIGTFVLDLKPSAIIKMWPISIFFVIFAISLFYNFATANGTLEKFAQLLLYKTQKVPKLLPFAIFICATIMSTLGAGFFAVMAFFAPITVVLCRKTGLSPLIGALAVNYGALCGHNFMISPGGVVFIGLMEQAGIGDVAYTYEFYIFLVGLVIPLIVLSVLMLFQKGMKQADTLTVERPDAFTVVQKRTLGLIFAMVAVLLAFPILSAAFPTVKAFVFLKKSIDVGLVAIIFTVIGLFLNLGKEKELVKNVPWGTLIMICGVGMLISVAVKAGTIQALSAFVSHGLPTALIPLAMAIVGGIMSFFSSTTGVVTPALFPVVSSLVAASGINAFVLFSSIVIGAQATAISPFSTGGSMMLSAEGDENREAMFNKLMFKAAPICLGAAAIYAVAINLVL